ncbi:MAG: hypothetical protein QOG04_2346 [Actinomycetota bacterium]|jgi:predicted DNA-binding ribbon-helix-helix protein|nr:hypothetical protein [Actinomycetota bacterium]
MDDKLLGIYLNDHLAGAAAGLELARRTLGNNEGTIYESFLRDLVVAIEEDKAELETLMDTLGISHDRLKQGAAWMAEKAGRLKLNGQLTGYSPLSRLVEFEGLFLGVTGKRSLWRSLKQVAAHDSRLAVTDFDKLIARADEQRAAIEEHRLTAAADALT